MCACVSMCVYVVIYFNRNVGSSPKPNSHSKCFWKMDLWSIYCYTISPKKFCSSKSLYANWGISLEDGSLRFQPTWLFIPTLIFMRFSYICIFLGSLGIQNSLHNFLGCSRICLGLTYAFGSQMLSEFFHAGCSWTVDQIFSHSFCNYKVFWLHDSVDEAQTLHSLGRFSHILDT